MSKKFLRTLIAVLLVCAMLPLPGAGFAEEGTAAGWVLARRTDGADALPRQ